MLNEELKSLIIRNEIDIDLFQKEVYTSLLLSVFENICLKMNDKNIRQDILSEFHRSYNHIDTTENIVLTYTGSRLSRCECEKIFDWLVAYFRKSTTRRIYSKDFKMKLLAIQNNKCMTCGKIISYNDSELDHIIPWHYVGDELENNLQMLCSNCNERKGKSINFKLKMLLING